MHNEIIEIDGKIIIEDEKRNKRECENRKDLETILSIENRIEYLEDKVDNCEKQIDHLVKEIESGKDIMKKLKVTQAIVTVFAFAGALFIPEHCILPALVKYLAAFSIPVIGYGIIEIPKIMLKKDMHNDEKNLDFNIVSLKFLNDDLAKEKEKQTGKVSFKNPTFTIKKVDDVELNKYIDKYDNMSALYNNIEVVETSQEPKKLGQKSTFNNKNRG